MERLDNFGFGDGEGSWSVGGLWVRLLGFIGLSGYVFGTWDWDKLGHEFSMIWEWVLGKIGPVWVSFESEHTWIATCGPAFWHSSLSLIFIHVLYNSLSFCSYCANNLANDKICSCSLGHSGAGAQSSCSVPSRVILDRPTLSLGVSTLEVEVPKAVDGGSSFWWNRCQGKLYHSPILSTHHKPET